MSALPPDLKSILRPAIAELMALVDATFGPGSREKLKAAAAGNPAPVATFSAEPAASDPAVPPELLAALLQARIEGNDAGFDSLVELGSDPQGLSEFIADQEAGTAGMASTKAFAGRLSAFADMAGASPRAAGLAIRAADTGRLLMIQRANADTDPHAGLWEFPGGKIEEGEAPEDAARREWSEETGGEFPEELATPSGTWRSPNGVYHGFIHEVPSEDALSIAGAGDRGESLGWWPKDAIRGNPAMRPELASDPAWFSDSGQNVKVFGWFADPTARSSSRATNSDSGQHAYGDRARSVLAWQGREDKGEAHPKTPKQQLVENKQAAEPKREDARKAYQAAINDPSTVRAKTLEALAAHLKTLTRDEVRQNLRQLEKATGGKLKHELVDALLAHVQSNSVDHAKKLQDIKDANDDPLSMDNLHVHTGEREGRGKAAGIPSRGTGTPEQHGGRMFERDVIEKEHGPEKLDKGSVRHLAPGEAQGLVSHKPSPMEEVVAKKRPGDEPGGDAVKSEPKSPKPTEDSPQPMVMPSAASVTKSSKPPKKLNAPNDGAEDPKQDDNSQQSPKSVSTTLDTTPPTPDTTPVEPQPAAPKQESKMKVTKSPVVGESVVGPDGVAGKFGTDIAGRLTIDREGKDRWGSPLNPIRVTPSKPLSQSSAEQMRKEGKNPDDFRISGVHAVPKETAESLDAALAKHHEAVGEVPNLNRDTANKTAEMFRKIGGFSSVDLDEHGFNSGVYHVQLRNVNSKSGNRNLFTVDFPVTDEKQAKLIAKLAQGKATDRDREALNRIAAEKRMDREEA